MQSGRWPTAPCTSNAAHLPSNACPFAFPLQQQDDPGKALWLSHPGRQNIVPKIRVLCPKNQGAKTRSTHRVEIFILCLYRDGARCNSTKVAPVASHMVNIYTF